MPSNCHQTLDSKNGMMHPAWLGRLGRLGPWWRRWKLARAAKKQVIWLWRLCGSVFDVIWLSHGKLSQLDTLITTCTSSRNGKLKNYSLFQCSISRKCILCDVRKRDSGNYAVCPKYAAHSFTQEKPQWTMMKETKCSHRLQTRSLCLRCLVPVLHTFALGVLPWAAFYVFACVAFGSRRRATAGEIVSAPSNFWSIFWSSTGPRPQRVGNVSVTPAVFGQHFSTEPTACCEPFGGPQKIKISGEKWPNLRVDMGMTWYDRVWPYPLNQTDGFSFLVAVHVLPLGSWCQWCPIDYVLFEA